MANALARLGTAKSWIVHGLDGLDEISPGGPTLVAEVENGSVKTFEISPRDCMQEPKPLEGIRVGSADESADIVRAVLSGTKGGDVAANIVSMNAAAAFYIAGHAESITDGFSLAVESIKNGHAMDKLNELARAVKG